MRAWLPLTLNFILGQSEILGRLQRTLGENESLNAIKLNFEGGPILNGSERLLSVVCLTGIDFLRLPKTLQIFRQQDLISWNLKTKRHYAFSHDH